LSVNYSSVIVLFIGFIFFAMIVLTIILVVKNSNQPQNPKITPQNYPAATYHPPSKAEGIPQEMFCPICGEKRIQGMNFCSSCGYQFSKRSEGRYVPQSDQIRTPEPAYQSQPQYYQNVQPSTSSKRFTPKRVTCLIGQFMIVVSGVIPWSINRNWDGIFNGGYHNYNEIGLQTPSGVIAVIAAIFGIILILSVHNERTAYVLSLICASISFIAAIIFKTSSSWGESGGYEGFWSNYSSAGLGVYLVFLGALIVLGCLFIPARSD
jgi:hypothetical protein